MSAPAPYKTLRLASIEWCPNLSVYAEGDAVGGLVLHVAQKAWNELLAAHPEIVEGHPELARQPNGDFPNHGLLFPSRPGHESLLAQVLVDVKRRYERQEQIAVDIRGVDWTGRLPLVDRYRFL